MTTASHAPAPLLLALVDLRALFPSLHKDTIYRWHHDRPDRKSGKLLPTPFLHLPMKPLWSEQQIREFAAKRGLTIDEDALERIRSERPATP